jgi:hypothetical protein
MLSCSPLVLLLATPKVYHVCLPIVVLGNIVESYLCEMQSLFGYLSDEWSMKSQSVSTREEHRLSKKGRQDLDANRNQKFDGVPLQYQFGDAGGCQVPPKMPHSLDAVGRLILKDFLKPRHESDHYIPIIMDKVIHQKDPAFKAVLQEMRDGTMDDEALDFLLKCCFEQL